MVHSHFWNLDRCLPGQETAHYYKIFFIKACHRLSPYTYILHLSDIYINIMLPTIHISQDSIVDVVIHYGLDGPGIKSWWSGKIFYIHLDKPLGSFSFLYSGYRALFRGVKQPGHGNNYPPPYSAKVRESRTILYSPSGLSRYVVGWTLPLLFICLSNRLFHDQTMNEVSCSSHCFHVFCMFQTIVLFIKSPQFCL